MAVQASLEVTRGIPGVGWQGETDQLAVDEAGIRRALLDLQQPAWAVDCGGKTGLTTFGKACPRGEGLQLRAMAPALPVETLGDAAFRRVYGTRCSFYAGSMANGISSEEMVIALGKTGLMGSFGAGGLSPARIESAIGKIRAALPHGPYAFNLLNSPNEPALEMRTVELYLQHHIGVIEASAYLSITPGLVLYRLAGLRRGQDGEVGIGNRIIAKISRLEMARRFLEPAPAEVVNELVGQGKVTREQAEMARCVPMADDITVEADSGGHTDNRPLVCMIPAFVQLRDEMQQEFAYREPVRIGAAGGIGTPDAALAAFMLGAAYIVTGSVNQGCVESGASPHTRSLLAQMDMADVAMAPAGDMFEMGVKVQVLKRGTMFAQRAQKLWELYSRYNAWEEIPPAEREKLEKTVFKREFAAIWEDTARFFMERDPRQVERGNASPKDKMALVFRWYLGLSSRWSASGEAGREMDYQVWSGPAMGAFNRWVKGTSLEDPPNRRVVEVNLQILQGCAYLQRLRALAAQGVILPAGLQKYIPGII